MSADACPVDHGTRQAWLDQQLRSGSSSSGGSAGGSAPVAFSPSSSPSDLHSAIASRPGFASFQNNDAARAEAFFKLQSGRISAGSSRSYTSNKGGLSDDRVISTIPRSRSTPSAKSPIPSNPTPQPATENPEDLWVYPSPAQFYNALARKNHKPQVADMSIVVPIHNAVNERAWQQILSWEDRFHPESKGKCGGVKLISFQGKPKEKSWKAWFKTTLLGYAEPFDRHDWLVDRCGDEVRYVIDFYTGKQQKSAAAEGAEGQETGLVKASAQAAQGQPNLSFYLDVRPAPDSWDNLKMRLARLVEGERR